jgi:phosphoglycolate phosphatase-like HAD superfamily hydrolase
LTTNQTLIGIQGFAHDFLLTLSYVSQATSNKAEIENQMALLQSLVDSFKLIKPANVDEQERKSQVVGDQRYQKYIDLYAKQVLENQSGLLMEQWSELGWEQAESRERVIRDIKRFKKAIEVFTGDDKHLDELKDLLNELTQMSLSEMKAFMTSKDQLQP